MHTATLLPTTSPNRQHYARIRSMRCNLYTRTTHTHARTVYVVQARARARRSAVYWVCIDVGIKFYCRMHEKVCSLNIVRLRGGL